MTVLFFIFYFLIIVAASVLWASQIDYMSENHPDYTGDDFLK
jgi:hypothetical protein